MKRRTRQRMEWLAVGAILVGLPAFFAVIGWLKRGYLQLTSGEAVTQGLVIGAVADVLLLMTIAAAWWRGRTSRSDDI